ncbi:MAG: DNA polymerase III subunit alpha [Spirochaetota bacterium]
MEHSSFVHLHVHSEYSILDGSTKIDDLIDKALQYRMPALALTDHGNLFGALEFYKKVMSSGMKPILGEEFYLAPQSLHSRDQKERPFHIILIAKEEEGYKNLIYLSSIAYLEGFYYKPRIDRELLSSRSRGLIGLSSCLAGEIPSCLLQGRFEEAERLAGEYMEILGKGNFYFELMDNGLEEQRNVNRELIKLSGKVGVKLVATNDIHYLDRSDAGYHDILLCIQTGKTVNDKNRLRFRSNQFYFRSPQEMITLFKETPEAIQNTIEIAEKCNLNLEMGKLRLPHFPIPQGYTADSFLRKLTLEGIKRRYRNPDEGVMKRMEMELEVISSMGFSTYFLIVWDFIQFAKAKGIAVGPGRGSAAGSIVAYALGITDVDPLRYGLLFERFLNVSRISMPDIDIDFDGDRRDEVIDYVRKKYGEDRVAQIITFGAMKARAVLRDVARSIDFPVAEVDRIAKMVPSRPDITIEDALNGSRELGTLIKNDVRVKQLFDVARGLERLVRHPSTHAAGVVISPEPLMDFVPLYRDPKSGVISTQYQAKDLEDVGLIKMDFLGLKNLTIIQRCLRAISEAGLELPDMNNLDLEDKKVYEMLSSGRSTGVFQLESSGMQNLMKKLLPNRFEDIIAVLALYRPGPIDSGMVSEFIERKQGRKPIEYPDKRLEPVLRDTYGVIVYQEQVMEIARIISGFTMAEADNLRKAMGKKKVEILEETREAFIIGATRNGVDSKVAEEIFELIRTFGRYGFNKSHSTAYALLAYQTAYLKAHYTVFYLSSLLSGELNNTDKLSEYIYDAREAGIEVWAPDINKSGVMFQVEGDAIRYALAAIKNVGESAAKIIVEERSKGEYKSLFDFTARVDLRLVNRRVLESLIKSGAMDCLGDSRRTLFENLDRALEHGTSMQEDKLRGQSTLFEGLGEEESSRGLYQLPSYEEWSPSELAEYEREALGFYFRAHPIMKYRGAIERLKALGSSEIREMSQDSRVTLFGIVSSLKLIFTRDNKQMAFVTLEDLEGSIEVVVFPSVYEKYSSSLVEKSVVVIYGKLSGEKILAEKVCSPEEAEKETISALHIMLNGLIDEEKLLRLRDIILKYRGKCSVYIHCPELETKRSMIKASEFLAVEPHDELLKILREEKLVERVWLN